MANETLKITDEIVVDLVIRHGLEADLTVEECSKPRVFYLTDTREFVVSRGDGSHENITREVKENRNLLSVIQSTLGDVASVQFVNEQIAKAQLEGAGVDTSNFVMRSELNEVVSDKVGEKEVSKIIAQKVLLNISDVESYIPGPTTGTKNDAYNMSTFSGWVSKVVAEKDFVISHITSAVMARDKEITQVRVRVAEGERADANVIFDRTMEISVPPQAERDIKVPVGGLLVENGTVLYISFEFNQICSSMFDEYSHGETTSWYVINGNMSAPLERFSSGTTVRLWFEFEGTHPSYVKRTLSDIREEVSRISTDVGKAKGNISTILEEIDSLATFNKGDKEVLDPFSEGLAINKDSYAASDQIMLGAGSSLGFPEFVDGILIGLTGNVGNTTKCTKLFYVFTKNPRYVNGESNYPGDVIHSGEILIDVAPGEEKEVYIDFPERYYNTDGSELYCWWVANNYVSYWTTTNSKDFSEFGCTRGSYFYLEKLADGSKNPDTESFYQRRVSNPELAHVSPQYFGDIGPYIKAIHSKVVPILSPAMEEEVRRIAGEGSKVEELSEQVEELSEQVEEAVGSVDTLTNVVGQIVSFESLPEIQNTFPLNFGNVSWAWTGSTFMGWGTPVGVPEVVSGIYFRVRAQSANTEPITKIIGYLSDLNNGPWSGSQLGNVLRKNIINVQIAPGEEKEIYLPLDRYRNTSGSELYASFICNGYVDMLASVVGFTVKEGQRYIGYYYNGSKDKTPVEYWEVLAARETVTISDLYNASAAVTYPVICTYIDNTSVELKEDIAAPLKEEIKDSILEEVNCDDRPRVVLPDEIQAVVGDTLQLFYRGFIEHPYPYIYNIEVACSVGKTTNRYYELTPTVEQVGNHTLTVNVRDYEDKILSTATTTIKVVPVATAPASVTNILCMGDSLTAAGKWHAEFYRRLTASDGEPAGNGLGNINFIGTKGTGEAKHEGYGGWVWGSFLIAPNETSLDVWVYSTHDKTGVDQHSLWVDGAGNVWKLETLESNRIKFTREGGHTGVMPSTGALIHKSGATHTESIQYTQTQVADGNPFWNTATGSVDFQDYCDRNGFGKIDYLYTLLTWNFGGGFLSTSKITGIVTQAKSLIRKFHEQFPDAKVKMMGVQLPSLNGGCGANYGATGGYYNAYALCRDAMQMNIAYQAMANEEEFASYVEFVNVSAQFDSENNMPEADKPVNTRSTKTEKVGNNGVHPSIEGYYQIADVAYRNFIASLNE